MKGSFGGVGTPPPHRPDEPGRGYAVGAIDGNCVRALKLFHPMVGIRGVFRLSPMLRHSRIRAIAQTV